MRVIIYKVERLLENRLSDYADNENKMNDLLH
jgi:hypothetical protein